MYLAKVNHVYVDPALPRELRNRSWQALITLFSVVFEPYVGQFLGHCSERHPTQSKLHADCYMWWDVSPYYPESQYATDDDHGYFLATCAHCLRSDQGAIQESALHGLGHALGVSRLLAQPVHDLIDEYLTSGRIARKELIGYAKRARRGRVL
jgi:hypothetical protein